MDIRDVQSRLAAAHLYSGKVDGDPDPLTKAAVKAFLLQQGVRDFDAWPIERRLIAARQLICRVDGIEVGAIDGRMGPQSRYAFEVFDARKIAGSKAAPDVENWRNDAAATPAVPSRLLPVITSSQANAPSRAPVWPRQSAMDSFYGPKGSGQVMLTLPFAMRIAWDLDSRIPRFSCHRKVKESLERIFVRMRDHDTVDEIRRLKLDLFGGCLNVRKQRGGSAWSMHSWGSAVDIDPEHNQLKFKRAQATLDNPPFDPFWRFVYDEGAIGLGRERDYDWMHFQFARL